MKRTISGRALREMIDKGDLEGLMGVVGMVADRAPKDAPVSSPTDVAARVAPGMWALDQEELWVVLLDTRNRITKTVQLYRGSLNTSQVRIAEVFKDAIRDNAASIIVAHNHPSGDPAPSPEDVAVTRAMVQAGKLLDIPVLDHLVVGKGQFVSMKEKGLIFDS